MRWKQFFTPAKSLDALEARAYMTGMPADTYTLLDVRQPEEYESEHLPGAKLIPMLQLGDRLSELDREKPTIVYCAIGGRSRVAAQVLAAKGFKEVINLSGGIKAWNGNKAIGPEDLGLEIFSGAESALETLVTAFGLEEGLRRFYISMTPKLASEPARRLFEKLAAIEVKHQDRLLNEYSRISGTSVGRDDFVEKTVLPAMEGGLTTEQYIERYQPDLESTSEIVSLAMAIEAQALDLYQRAADRAKSGDSRAVLIQMAEEERAHIDQLGKLFRSFP